MYKKFLYFPVYTLLITQTFGEDKVCIATDGSGKLVSKKTFDLCPAGYKSVYSNMKGHNGWDIVAGSATEVYASDKGKVIEVQTEEARGLGVGILHEFEGRYFKTRYWHLKSIAVKLGQDVPLGQFIGLADNTGYSTGDHLHFEVKETDKDGNTLYNDNGYLGALNPALVTEMIFVLKIQSLEMLIKRAKEQVAQIVQRLANLLRK